MTAYTITCCSSPPNEPGKTQFFVSMQTNWRSTDLGPAQTKSYGTSPGPELPTDATARTRSVLVGSSPRRGNASGFRRTFEARGLGAHFATDPTARTRSVLVGPSPRRGNASGFRRTFEARGLGAHFARWARAAAPCPTRTPLTTTWSFMSRRHQSRGHQRYRTGRQSGQAIAREGAQRPGMKLYLYVCV